MKRSTLLRMAAATTAFPGAAIAQDANIRIGAVPTDFGGEAWYAADGRFFEREHLNVSVVSAPNTNVILEALLGGSMEIGYLAMSTLAVAFKKGAPLVAIAPSGLFDASKGRVDYIMVRNGVDIKTPKDFEGKTIASVPLRSIGELSVNLWIDKNGGDSSKVKYLEVPFPSLPAALQQGRVDGAIVIQPYATAAKEFATVVGPDPMTAVGSYWLTGVFAATKVWAAAHPDEVRRFRSAMRATADWANTNPAKSAVILAKYSNQDTAAITAYPRVPYAEDLSAAAIQPTIDLLARYKLIDSSFSAQTLIYQAPK